MVLGFIIVVGGLWLGVVGCGVVCGVVDGSGDGVVVCFGVLVWRLGGCVWFFGWLGCCGGLCLIVNFLEFFN